MKLNNKLSNVSIIIILILAIFFLIAASQLRCSANEFWQIATEVKQSENLSTGFEVIALKGGGRPRLRFYQDIFRKNDIDWYQISFTVNTLEDLEWFRLGLGGYQEDKQKHSNFNPQSDLYLLLEAEKIISRLELDGELRIFITDLSLGFSLENCRYILNQDKIDLGLSVTGTYDSYQKEYGVGAIGRLNEKDYQISVEYFFGDINWRLRGEYCF